MPMILEYRNDATKSKVIFDDDGKTGYAYLILGGVVVGDVWLYNVGKAPRKPEWPDPDKLPFANPTGFASEDVFDPITDSSEIRLDWSIVLNRLEQVTITLRGIKHAVLRPGAKPGWCRLAVTPSPIANPLNEEFKMNSTPQL